MSGRDATLETLSDRLFEFRDARDWRQFHLPKNLIVSLNPEAAGLLEPTRWKSAGAIERMAELDDGHARFSQECADVSPYLILIAERAGLNPVEIAEAKIDVNERKYPVEKARGAAARYSDL